MKLIVVAVGTRMPSWVEAAWQEYAKRLPPDCALELREAKRVETALPAGCFRIGLDERGKDLTTTTLAAELEKWRSNGQDVAFLIGGPDGLDASLKASCHSLMRLSSLTLPHPMVRVVLAEQLYRAWAITTGHPYHRA
jgi:23S rRNA (pseudouridine1915-N3)-methyltransferase